VAGGGHPLDPRWLTDEWADDHETWGKTTARKRGLAIQKESPNGGAKRCLASGEGAVAAHPTLGKMGREGEASAGVCHTQKIQIDENLKSFINHKLNEMSCCIHTAMHLFLYWCIFLVP
jgi:hypothetical protein